ncbi:hypothetical protein U1Q18_034107 [Sarracenia purpurea var. burkii]
MIIMETLVVVSQHQNQYYSRTRTQGPASLGSFECPSSIAFGDINCRTFQSESGILPTPLKACTTPIAKRECSYSTSPKTPSPSPSPSVNYPNSEESKHLKKSGKIGATSISINVKVVANKEGSFGEFSYSELWAGPAYSNSPPPSSLPIPKFSLRPKRTVSLDLPLPTASDFNFHPIAKSAPPSPTRDHSNSSSRDLCHFADSATKTLRRILNLDIADE